MDRRADAPLRRSQHLALEHAVAPRHLHDVEMVDVAGDAAESAARVVQALVGHVFDAHHLQRLIARTDPANVGSITILDEPLDHAVEPANGLDRCGASPNVRRPLTC